RSGAHRDGGVLTIGTRGHQRRDSTSRRVPVVTPTIFSVSASLRLAQLWVSWTGWRICEPLVSISIFPVFRDQREVPAWQRRQRTRLTRWNSLPGPNRDRCPVDA